MITQLYVFSPGSYVIAEEWNANFRVLKNVNLSHQEAITDAFQVVMFKGGDYTPIYNRVNNTTNSSAVIGNSFVVTVDNEYYKELGSGEQVVADVGHINGEARIILKTAQNDSLPPLRINYIGGDANIVWPNGIAHWFLAGMKFVFLLERNNKLYVKMIATE